MARYASLIKIGGPNLLLAIIAALTLCCSATETSVAQSFNCLQATKADEIAICRSARFSSLDEQLSSMFFRLRNGLSITQQKVFTSGQQTWLGERAMCGSDASCIERIYEKRLSQLGSPVDSGGWDSRAYQQPKVLATLAYDGAKPATLHIRRPNHHDR